MADTTLMASANNSGCGGSTAFAAVVHAAMTAAGISFVIAVDPPPTLISVARGTRIIANVVLKADAISAIFVGLASTFFVASVRFEM